jgi:hypothetical protein
MRIPIITICAMMLVSLSGGRIDAQSLTPPSGHGLLLSTFGDGVQIYTGVEDTANPGQFVWLFQSPRADLFDGPAKQTLLGIHYAGPTWEANDGSTVVARRIDSSPSPHPNAIPQLLLEATAHTGTGLFSNVTYIQRLDTVGGMAPAALPTRFGEVFEVPYTATYNFFAVPEPGAVALLVGLAVPGAALLLRRPLRRKQS